MQGGSYFRIVEQALEDSAERNRHGRFCVRRSDESAAEIISTSFDYTIDPLWFIVTALVIGGYFLFLVRYSDKEYREVISERFE